MKTQVIDFDKAKSILRSLNPNVSVKIIYRGKGSGETLKENIGPGAPWRFEGFFLRTRL